MTYSFTEKKRIRRQFGVLPNVMPLPYLLKTQTDSYSEFLQVGSDPDNRDESGLEEVFQSIFPINSASGNAALDYIGYELGECLFTPQECKTKGISYAVHLRIRGCGAEFNREIVSCRACVRAVFMSSEIGVKK